jgi:hypothetical protein
MIVPGRHLLEPLQRIHPHANSIVAAWRADCRHHSSLRLPRSLAARRRSAGLSRVARYLCDAGDVSKGDSSRSSRQEHGQSPEQFGDELIPLSTASSGESK